MMTTATLTDEELQDIEGDARFSLEFCTGTGTVEEDQARAVLALLPEVYRLRDEVMEAYAAGHQHGIWGDPESDELRAKGYVR